MELEDSLENGTSESGAQINTEKDGLLSQEQEDLSERVISLEKKVQQQADEVVCLKSALSDVIRRLSHLEADKAIKNNVLPSKPIFKATSAKKSPAMESRRHLSALDNASLTPVRNGQRPRVPLSPCGPQSMKKWSSLSNSTELNNASVHSVKNCLDTPPPQYPSPMTTTIPPLLMELPGYSPSPQYPSPMTTHIPPLLKELPGYSPSPQYPSPMTTPILSPS
ncbi:uncharacterized protein LOC135466891 [Liolophura sinensis]|uniref:uncharacterized protein LOC135466891 n=1 Tax=Liolophura sinensis TaxID=3198878 RepID=UPI003158C7B1